MPYIYELIQCAMLKSTVYHKISDHPIWLIKSISVVAIAAFAIVITVLLDPSENIEQILSDENTSHAYYASLCFVSTFLGWVLWSIITHFVGIRLYFVKERELSRKVTYRLTLRATGYAYIPGILVLLLLLPFSIQWEKMICMLVWLCVLAIATVGIRTLHECGNIRALNSTLPGWFIAGAILFLFLYPYYEATI